jgi:exonuclease III
MGRFKIVSWNVNGLRPLANRLGLSRLPPAAAMRTILEMFDADIICMQETKLLAAQVSEYYAVGARFSKSTYCCSFHAAVLFPETGETTSYCRVHVPDALFLDPPPPAVPGWHAFFSCTEGAAGYSGVVTYCKASTATPAVAEEGILGCPHDSHPLWLFSWRFSDTPFCIMVAQAVPARLY